MQQQIQVNCCMSLPSSQFSIYALDIGCERVATYGIFHEKTLIVMVKRFFKISNPFRDLKLFDGNVKQIQLNDFFLKKLNW